MRAEITINGTIDIICQGLAGTVRCHLVTCIVVVGVIAQWQQGTLCVGHGDLDTRIAGKIMATADLVLQDRHIVQQKYRINGVRNEGVNNLLTFGAMTGARIAVAHLNHRIHISSRAIPSRGHDVCMEAVGGAISETGGTFRSGVTIGK